MALDAQLAQAYWTAATDDVKSQPPLPAPATASEPGEIDPDDPVARFIALLDGSVAAVAEGPGFRVTPLVSDPYPAIALADDATVAVESWAAEIANLLPFTSPALAGYVLFVDTIADPDGNHRVYPFVEDEPAEAIASLDEALRWMTAVVGHARHQVELAELEKVDAGLATAPAWQWSGAEVYDRLRALPLPDAYRALSNGGWPAFAGRSAGNVDGDEPGAARLAMLATVENVLRNPQVSVRTRKGPLVAAHQQLLEQLDDLTRAVAGQRPPRVVSEHPQLVELANQWLGRFAAAGVAGSPNDSSNVLRRAVGQALDSLVRTGAIEVDDGARAQLLEELALAAFDASNERQLLRKLRGALFRSDHVLDIYADDLALDETFRKTLGG